MAFSVLAATSFAPPENGIAEGMKVSPSKFEVMVKRGQEVIAPLVIRNESPSPLKITLQAWDFARDENGVPYQISKKDVAKFRGAAAWLRFSKKPVIVKSHDQVEVPVKVRAPKKASPGTHATYLQVVGKPVLGKRQNIKVQYVVNALFLPIFVGEAHSRLPTLKTKLKLVDFSVGQKFATVLPLSLRAEVRNDGNIHQNLEGAVEIWQGKTKLKTVPVEQTLLPGSTSHILAAVDDLPYLGRFTAKFKGSAFLAKNYKQQKLEARLNFIYIPKNIFYAAAGLLLLTFL
ncbi:MAG: hypothetical protein Q8L35_09295, partial [Actinomycetota bacterium]|nr:hypothetical protein [Actinomycetota bacterium]